MTYRTAQVNLGLCKIYDDQRLVGQVRRGLDNRWYPELPYETSRAKAIHRLILVDAALLEHPPDV